jgi:diguanylate cyclase (GGDEF)-like protein
MKRPSTLRGLLIYISVLIFWLAISNSALITTDIQTAITGIIALSVIAAFSFLLETTLLVSIACAAVIVAYGLLTFAMYGSSERYMYAIITFAAAAIGTTILAWHTRHQIVKSTYQMEKDRILLDELRVHDRVTGLMRFHYARRSLASEISRAMRFSKPVSLLLMRIERWDEMAEEIGLEARENVLIQLNEILESSLRSIDTVFVNMDKIGVILPETDEEGAVVAARRVIDQAKKKEKINLFIGIASFPKNSQNDDALLEKTEEALKEAIAKEKRLVFYQSIVDRVKNEEKPEKTDTDMATMAGEIRIDAVFPPETAHQNNVVLRFKGIKSLTQVEPIQKSLEQIPDFRLTRLVDFQEDELVFSTKTEAIDIESKLATLPGLNTEKITKTDDGFLIDLKD